MKVRYSIARKELELKADVMVTYNTYPPYSIMKS